MNWMINRRPESDQPVRSIDLTAVIGGRGTLYLCPDVAAVDQHIVRLYRQIEDIGLWLPELGQQNWADIDLLLERRMFLALDLQVSDAA
ncbi:MAG: hypothetical protein JWR81_2026 [Pseudonocardia sp.]|nr:hypothetical protein [Pseudonocardia sp.]